MFFRNMGIGFFNMGFQLPPVLSGAASNSGIFFIARHDVAGCIVKISRVIAVKHDKRLPVRLRQAYKK
jgi:hypothetical protein